jgi:hypothetical protein
MIDVEAIIGLLFIITSIILVVLIILVLIDNNDEKCLDEVDNSEYRCNKGHPDCSKVSKYCSIYSSDRCNFDRTLAINDMCPDDYVKRVNIRMTIAIPTAIIWGLIFISLTGANF